MKKLLITLLAVLAFGTVNAMEYGTWTDIDQTRGFHTFYDDDNVAWYCPMNRGDRKFIGDEWACTSKNVEYSCTVLGWGKGAIGDCKENTAN